MEDVETESLLNDTSDHGRDNAAMEAMDEAGNRSSLDVFSMPISADNGLGYNNKTWAGRTALQTEGLTLSWHHINVEVKTNEEKRWCRKSSSETVRVKKLLKDVSGCAEPGHLLAIMGASGAGKTTLLNILTGRSLENLEVHGEVRVNGHNLGRSITRMSAYVQQDDLFIGTLTVKEHLIFQAILRMDRHLTYKERLLRVDDVLHELGLMKCADTYIGIPGRLKGISGGEMKRLAFASEVLTNPSLMFCDEPTSGLDSFMAQSVVSVLKQMAAGGRTIVSTIHQPSSDTYAMFDRLLLMAEGRVAFLGESKEALDYFSRLGMRCPINFNPADFYIEQLAVIPGKEEECRQRIKLMCDEYEKTGRADTISETVKTDLVSEVPDKGDAPQYVKYKASWFSQLRILIWRCQIVVRRERLLTIVRLLQTVVISIIIGLIYWGQDMTQEGIMNINGALFLILTNLSFQNAMSVVTVFCEELPVFLREHWNGMYRTDTYFLSKMLAELPLFTFLPLLFISITYWWIGLYPTGYRFLVAIIVSVLVGNTACSFGYMVSGLAGSAQVASSILTPLMIPLLLFGGFFLNNSSVPQWLIWLKYLSWFYYSNEALCVNQWKDVAYISCSNTTATCMQNGTLVLESLHFQEDNMYPNIGYLVCLLVGFRVIAYVGVVLKARKRR